MSGKLKMAIISLITRRDLDTPLHFFDKIDVLHFYRSAPYGDMSTDEYSENLVNYSDGKDLFEKLVKYSPDFIQGIEPYTFPAGFQEYCAILKYKRKLKTHFFFPMLENRPPEKKFGHILSHLLKIYLKNYASKSDFVIPLNTGAKRNLLDIGIPQAKFKELLWGTWGVDVDEFSPGKEKDERLLLFVGRLDISKGIEYLLEAFKKIAGDFKNLRLNLVGEGPLKEWIASYIKNFNLEGRVMLQGTVKNKNLPEFFRRAALTISPSITTNRWEEQVGMVNIQSIACGTPVVSTLSGAIPEYIRNIREGILVPEKNSEAIAEAVTRLINDSELRRKMGEEGRKHVLDSYDARINIRKAEDFLLDYYGQRGNI
ncbi:MAG: glycosyltransferase family 4 protein [Firmicutes bacterium]|nr:glycosyltransferase family 4 protein [Bacillota bacterium]